MSDLDTGRTDGQPFDPTDLWVRTTAGAPPSIDGAASDSFAAETPGWVL